ncbi:DNA-binding protein [Acinetobacter sp. CAAS 2-6]|uniref:DNA-binding protein n=1 Tax=Acinetobacter sp. CAAS 2-6 TaxID=3016358 RepID=UPI002DD69D09|nr:DNA-binding protein [Acinetobacter sp. CAAS 2-6]
MAAKAITKPDVYNAIEQLLAETGHYTNAAIMNLIGGSSVTVQKYRKEYEREHRDGVQRKALSLKEAEHKRLSDAVADIMSGRITEVSDSHSSEIERLSEELDTVLIDKENLIQQYAQQLAEIEQLNAENLDLKAKIRVLEEGKERSRAEILEQYEKHKLQVNEQLELAKQQYDEAIKNYQDAQKDLKADKAQLISDHHAEKQQLQCQIHELQTRLAEAISSEKVTAVRYEEAQKQLVRASRDIAELKDEIRQMRNPPSPAKRGKAKEELPPMDGKTEDLLDMLE